MKSVLIIDDEADIRDILTYNLKKDGFDVLTAENGQSGIEKAKAAQPDIIILDVMMPEMDGIEVCQILRSDESTKNILICFLTARSEDYSQIAGLDAGADDYVSKPVKPRVLVSRIKAILRRNQQTNDTKSDNKEHGLIIDREKFVVTKNGEQIHLPRKEFNLLALLASKPGKVFDRDVILETVWGSNVVVGDRTIDVHVRKLRGKIGDDHIKTVKGVGYKFSYST
ncbi:MAG: response regulator transcription factor [Crocinitomicaceae bacterium]|nr:response regulator transcription factor [Crocinitomicaceae bacterium]|tara:strand:- start:1652 stop:2329 length:678 start_codon:yes stop_codon:yes gene_type:complete